jgi:hypothetical protein
MYILINKKFVSLSYNNFSILGSRQIKLERTGTITIHGNTVIMMLWYQESVTLDITGTITIYGNTVIM